MEAVLQGDLYLRLLHRVFSSHKRRSIDEDLSIQLTYNTVISQVNLSET